jgi:glycosyltransferase involved in cell wall biosynthesis
MKNIKKIVFWIPYACSHITDLIAAIADMSPEISILCFADKSLIRDRKELGWEEESYAFQFYVSPSIPLIEQTINTDKLETINIFYGFRWHPTIVNAIYTVKRSNAPVIIVQEPRVREGLAGELRYLQSLLTETWYRRHCLAVFAIGRHGPSWFNSIGYSPDKIYPFAYFVNSFDQVHLQKEKEFLHIGYVGRLIKMKGVDDLIQATSDLSFLAKLAVVGSGCELDALKKISCDLEVPTDFIGVIPKHKIPALMADFDILVLPSRSMDEGWGVVVSEALMQGTAVIASSCVGASILLNNPLAGIIVNANSPKEITAAITKLHDMNACSEAIRKQRMTWARRRLNADAGARYFLSILEYLLLDRIKPRAYYE